LISHGRDSDFELAPDTLKSEAVGGVTPSTIVVIAIFFSLATIAAAMVDERSRGCNRHFNL
jgi:hypothetical protein